MALLASSFGLPTAGARELAAPSGPRLPAPMAHPGVRAPAGSGAARLSSGSAAPAARAPSWAAVCRAAYLPGCPSAVPTPAADARPAVTSGQSWLNITPSPYPSAYPAARAAVGMAYDPLTETTLMFGGLDAAYNFYNDTWSGSGGNWTPLISTAACASPGRCPNPRAYAGFAYDLNDREAVLFGGLSLTPSRFVELNDTWVFAGGTWTNITATAGAAPSARFEMSMTYAASEGYVLLFGGYSFASVNGTYFADTWTFSHGKWTNITTTEVQTPQARDGAALADSPSGYTMLFGGANALGILYDLSGCPNIEWWFSHGQWTPAQTYTCIGLPHPGTGSSTGTEPCGRTGAALAWSPKNQHFVLFGGVGYPSSSGGCPATGSESVLNDTWVYLASPGAGEFYWHADPSSGAPSGRALMGAVADFGHGYVEIFGGAPATGVTNDTWRYIAVVSASLAGPLVLSTSTSALNFPLFTLTAFGGSGALDFEFNTTLLKTSNALVGGPNCTELTDHVIGSVPLAGVVQIRCEPSTSAYNVFRLSVSVWDTLNATAHAYANWTFTADPPESLVLYSQFTGTFFQGISFTNIFGVYAQIGNAPVTSISGTLGNGTSLSFAHANSSLYWWNASVNMMDAPLPAKLTVTVGTSDWSLNGSMALTVVQTPSWMLAFTSFPGVVQTTTPTGSGPFNESYSATQAVSVSLSKLFNFTLPSSVPLINGIYNLLPSIQVSFTESSKATISLSATLTLTPPALTFGVFSLTISASLQMTGTLSVQEQKGVETIDWVSALMTITIKGDFKANIPIYGYTFSILGNNITIGLSLSIDLAPSVALKLVMVPANSSAEAFANGLNFKVTQLLGDLNLPLTVSLNFGIGVASVSASGSLAVDVGFSIEPPPFAPYGIWVNGTISVSVQVLFWSTTWNLAGPANIYHGVPTPLRPAAAAPATYDNGTGAVWHLDARAYNGTGYDQLVWNPANATGVAISGIYPHADPTAASTYGGAYLFYSDDQLDQPVTTGLHVAGLALNASSNAATSIPTPVDPGFVVSAPEAATSPDGSIVVLWTALPVAQATGSSPSAVTTLALHGARYYPNNDTWGPVRSFLSHGFVASYALDAAAAAPIGVALVSPTLLPGDSTPESLVTFNLTSGVVVANTSVAGISRIESVSGAPGVGAVGGAILRRDTGNLSAVHLSDGTALSISYPAAANATLVQAQFVPGSAPTLLLRYRTPTAGLAVLYDVGTGGTIASVPLDGAVTDAQAIATSTGYDLYAANGSALVGWSVGTGAANVPLAPVPAAGLGAFGLAQLGGSVLIYGLEPDASRPAGNASLFLAEVGGGLPPVRAGAPRPAPSSGGTGGGGTSPAFNALLYLGVPLIAAVAVLALLAILRRRRAPVPPPSPPPTVG